MVRKSSKIYSFLLLGLLTATSSLAVNSSAIASEADKSLSPTPQEVVPESPLTAPKPQDPSLPNLDNAETYLPQDISPISLVIRLSQRKVYLYQGDTEVTSYPIAIGKAGWETPTGSYQILQMLRDPAWQHPWNGEVIPAGKDNPLGDRWIGFWTDGTNFIGFHGTPNETLVGQAVSHGCIRMKNDDVRALFDQVSLGTPVTVEP